MSESVSDGAFAPMMLAPFLVHWNSGSGEPVAATLNTAAPPGLTVLLSGCVEMVGAAGVTEPVMTKLIGVGSLCPASPIAMMVTLNCPGAVGVPVIAGV